MRLRLLFLLALAAGPLAAGGCDFTPVLDIELPEHDRALYLSGLVAADSTIAIRAGISEDPYQYDSGVYVEPERVTVLLQRDGAPDEVLGPQQCSYEDFQTGQTIFFDCPRVYATRTRLRPGETVRFVARADGLPDAVATVTIPLRPVVDGVRTDSVLTTFPQGLDVSFTLRDAPGADHYGLSIVEQVTRYDYTCEDPRQCPEGTQLRSGRYTSSDVILLANGRALPSDGYQFVAFSDQLFEGAARPFRIRAESEYFGEFETERPRRLRVTAISERLFEAYNITAFSLSGNGENPFAEAAELPSNVENGYGLVSGIAVFEAELRE